MSQSTVCRCLRPGSASGAFRRGSPLREGVARQTAELLRGQEPRQIAGPLWSLVHGIASLAIEGELRNVGIDQDPEDMLADALSDLTRAH
jgi:Tetracyclin repressor-like, C-terminal domain